MQSVVDYSANIIFGACIDSNISDEVEVTVIATGFPNMENIYDQKDERNVSSRNFFVNRGLPEGNPNAAAAASRPAPMQQPASPSYLRTPVNNTMNGQQPPVYRQPYQQAAPQQQYAQPQYQQQAPQYAQPQQQAAPQQQYAQPQYQQQAPQYAQPQQQAAPQQQYAQPQYQQQGQQYAQPPRQPQYQQQGAPGNAADKELPTFVQRLFKKK